jgi:copper transport protein
MARATKWKWLVAVVVALLVGMGLAYADLLRAAFQRNPVPRNAASIARGRALFQEDCAVCHGAQGRGDGPAAAGMARKPDDLSRIAPPPVFPDGVVAYRIRNGEGLMPAFGKTLREEQVWDLLNFIRALAPSP